MNTAKKDIETIDDIHLLVDTFYGKIRKDQLLGPIFDDRIQDRWPEHIAKMYTFWQTMLLGEHTYYGSPFVPHANLPVENHHFQQWLSLWQETLDSFWEGAKVDEALWRAHRMAQMFELKITQLRASGNFEIY